MFRRTKGRVFGSAEARLIQIPYVMLAPTAVIAEST
jgi:hypothetical protein